MADRDSDVLGFDTLCGRLEKAVRPSERVAYRAVVRSEQQRMQDGLVQARQSGG